MNLKIYEIDYHINQLLFDYTDQETGEIDPEILVEIKRLLEEKEIVLVDTLESLALEYQNQIALAEMYKQEKLRISTKQQVANARAETLKQILAKYFDQTNEKKIVTEKSGIQLSWRNSTSVEVLDEEKIPDKYKIPQKPKIDKNLLKEDLKIGDVDGAILNTSKNLQIK